VHHIKGSHHSLRHPNKPELRMVVPVHRKDLPLGTIRSIIKQSGLTEEEFLDLV
jgi:predicted RNA binding protein YcfA (HicA-like mRNA interferase family)